MADSADGRCSCRLTDLQTGQSSKLAVLSLENFAEMIAVMRYREGL